MQRPPLKSSGLRRRRLWYGGFRVAYVLWRTLYRGASLWHTAIAVAVALACALGLVWMTARTGWLPLSAYLVPLWLAGAYALILIATSFVRTWRAYPALRREMRRQRLADLRAGGLPRRQFERGTWLRVQVPIMLLGVAGGAFSAHLFPRDDWRRFVVVIVTVAVMCALVWWLEKWNRKFRPELETLCPKCGYNLAASPGRCPECGMRRFPQYGQTTGANFYDDDDNGF